VYNLDPSEGKNVPHSVRGWRKHSHAAQCTRLEKALLVTL
jgi:hypothetical protein